MIYIVLFFLSICITYIIRFYAKRKAILDIPNERSSHTLPTPRGGGLGIIILFILSLFYFYDSIDIGLFYALLCVIPIAVISFVDDIFTLSSTLRVSVQSISAIGAIYLLGGVNHIDFLIFDLDGWWLNILAFMTIIWLTNLYNFLDGIDGYASSQAVMVGLGLFIFFQNPLGLVIVSISLGFLMFNWHKASIFMGDVGSASLGFIFAVLIFYDTSSGNILIWMILLSLFWIDASVTLVRRYINGEKITQAHRKHAYQRLVQSGWSHSLVVLSSILFNLIFLISIYFVPSLWILFIINIISVFIIIRWIDTQKGFE